MLVSLRWLQDFIDLPTSDEDELAYAFDMLGLTVEKVDHLTADWSDVYVGEVLEIAPHPDADKIRVCQVDSGDGPTQIICGAWNFDEGATVAVARPGAVLAGDFEIGERTIRGVKSGGMICSERELGLGDDHAGILVLESGLTKGEPFADHVELPDLVFDLDVAPNRPDALSMVGVARDLAAYFNIDYRIPDVQLETVEGSTPISIEIEDPVGCRRFTAREIRGVTLGQSPFKLRHRLHKVGIRSISNVVDVTNYVMFELGHPLHAFDADTIAGDKLVIKRASQGESLKTLDGEDRRLHADDLIIYDEEGPTSMSGTMGGARSEVSESTKRVLMEAASWDPPTIMHMWRRHALRSEAATRFERGVDPNLADIANQRASAMVADLTGGEVLIGAVDEIVVVIEPLVVDLTIHEVRRLLGDAFTVAGVTDVLTRIGMKVDGDDPMRVTVPTFRPDSYRPADLIEEVARIHGFDKFEATLPIGSGGGLTAEQRRVRMLRQALSGAGLHHAVNLPFVDAASLENFEIDEADLLTIKNPLREQESKLRPTLLTGLADNIRYNQSHGSSNVSFFEIGNVFTSSPDPTEPRLPTQYEKLAWVAVGEVGLRILGVGTEVADASYSMALWRHVAQALGIIFTLEPTIRPGFHPGRTAVVKVLDEVVGYVGELTPAVGKAFGIEGRVAAAELDLAPLIGPRPSVQALAPSVFPPVDFDLSFLVDDSTLAVSIVTATTGATEGLIEEATVFDEYRGENVADGRKALAIRYRLRAPDRTLEQSEIAAVRDSMIDAAKALGATLRGAR